MNFQILIFEDDKQRAEKFVRNLRQKLPDHDITFIHEVDNKNLKKILSIHSHSLNLILIDRDLNGDIIGKDVIEEIVQTLESDPLHDGLPMVYYSSNHPKDMLEDESRGYGIYKCCNFKDLEHIVMNIIRT